MSQMVQRITVTTATINVKNGRITAKNATITVTQAAPKIRVHLVTEGKHKKEVILIESIPTIRKRTHCDEGIKFLLTNFKLALIRKPSTVMTLPRLSSKRGRQ